MSGDTPVIRTYDLTKRFRKVTAVDAVSFSVQRGEVFGFLGPNGAGKTTTIAMLLGLVHPTAGSAEVLGCDIRRGLSKALPRVGAIVETPTFYPYMSAADNLLLVSLVVGDGADRQIPALLEQVGLEGRGADKVGTYSLGMRQRLGLAAALLGNPELLILDEPTNGLDPAGMHEVRLLIRRLADEQGTTVFLSSHLLHEVEQVCDSVVILNKGRLIAQGRVDQLLSQAHGVEMRIDRPACSPGSIGSPTSGTRPAGSEYRRPLSERRSWLPPSRAGSSSRPKCGRLSRPSSRSSLS
jgi:ABC-2 type transport system ATP-binding protein